MSFHPPRLLRNRHIQSILASSRIRKPLFKKSALRLQSATREVILPSGNLINLHCLASEHAHHTIDGNTGESRPLAILIHGWEGSANSTYIQSTASALFDKGYDIIRMHLRDHGPTHHMNTGLFHAARIDEVVAALKAINRLFPRERSYLAGFSLGGNFALRAATQVKTQGLKLDKIVAISPVINPTQTMAALENGSSFYRTYFMRKWRKSLTIKHAAFPEKVKLDEVKNARNLLELTELLVDQHTEFTSVNEYFSSYTLTGATLAAIDIPTEIITSQDDPVIPIHDFKDIEKPSKLNIQVHAYGGHCGFIKNYALDSWINEELLRQFK
jgi:predicted alpha/beta-fold hydrolase